MTHRRRFPYWLALAASFVAAGALIGCEQGAEGDRCNPALTLNGSDECNSGLSCVTPSSCVISVCCPSAPPYTDPQCECFVHPEGCACNVDAAYDTGSPSAPSIDSGVGDAAKDGAHE